MPDYTGGAETRVNSYAVGDQRSQQITALADGGWLVTWQSNGQDGDGAGIYQQRYSASGATVGIETRVNSYTASEQSSPKVTALAGGGWVVAWNSQGQEVRPEGEPASVGAFQRVFTAAGEPLGIERQINTATYLAQQDPVPTGLSGGGWATVWTSQEDNGTPFGEFRLYHRIYDASGGTVTTETALGASLSGQLSAASVAPLASGGWVAVFSTSGSNTEVYQQVFSATGTLVQSTTQVNTYAALNQTDARVDGLKNGGWVVTWTSFGQDGNSGGIYQQAYNPNGSKLGGEVRVNSTTANNESQSQVVALEGGGWVVLWQSENFPNRTPLYLQAYDAAGNKLGGETLLTGPSNVIPQHQIVALSDGGWVAVWNANDGTGNGIGVRMQIFAADGSKTGDVQTVNEYLTGEQGLDASVGRNHSKVVALANGGFVITWISKDQAGSGYDVYQRAYGVSSPNAPTDIKGTLKFTEGKTGTAGTLAAVDPNDTKGFAWSLVDDAGGRFKIDAASGKVSVKNAVLLDYEQAKSHAIVVQVTDKAGNSFTKTLTVKGIDVAMENLTGSSKADTLYGGSKADIFKGGKGDDTFRGGGGNDTLDGGKGKDTADYSDKTKSVEVTLNTSKAVTVTVGGKAEDSIKNIENLIGGSKADTLTGDSASNVLDGGKGKDVLKGGAGKDFFVFDTALGSKNVDTIVDFKPKDDTIRLDDAIFTALNTGALSADAFVSNKTGEAADASDRIIYQKTTGKLFYDADGNGAAAHKLFAVLTDHPKITAADFEII